MSDPCGPHSECNANGVEYTCKCLSEMINRPPNCRPECSTDSHCPDETLCINYRCRDPCAIGICGTAAECNVLNHKPICKCPTHYDGDPYIECILNQANRSTPCEANPCNGVKNTMCVDQNGVGTCVCLPNFYRDSEKGGDCMPTCAEHTDCPLNHSCIQSECRDLCKDICPENADCHITSNRVATCTCKLGFTGDSYRNCTKIVQSGKNFGRKMNFFSKCKLSYLFD